MTATAMRATTSLGLCTLAPVGRRATSRSGQAAPALVPALVVGLALLGVYQGRWAVDMLQLF